MLKRNLPLNLGFYGEDIGAVLVREFSLLFLGADLLECPPSFPLDGLYTFH
jgi:hypothetical protein